MTEKGKTLRDVAVAECVSELVQIVLLGWQVPARGITWNRPVAKA